MALSLTYSNKYHFWSDVLRGQVDRLFIPCDEPPTLATAAAIEVSIADLGLRAVIRGTVVGQRPGSRRFSAGAFVRFGDNEVAKARRFLGMGLADIRGAQVRRATRVHHETEVRFLDPELPAATTKNISSTGLLLAGVAELLVGQRVRIQLELGGETATLDAEVAWVAPGRRAVGVQLVNLDGHATELLYATVHAAVRHLATGQRPDPILVADRDHQIVEALSLAFSKQGFEVFQASTSEETLGLVRELHPRLVVIDILVPQIDGVGTCHAIRGDAELVDIPVIFLAQLDATALHSIAHDAGASDFLTKPADMAELVDLAGMCIAPA